VIGMFREMRRFRQQLTTEECEAVLRKQPRGVLAVLGDDDYPYTVPLNFVFEDGGIFFHTALQGHKLDAIRKCDKGSFCVLSDGELSDDGWSYCFKSVVAFGRLCILPDDEKIAKLRLLGQKYFPTEEMVESDIEKNASRCAVVELRIEHLSGKRVHER